MLYKDALMTESNGSIRALFEIQEEAQEVLGRGDPDKREPGRRLNPSEDSDFPVMMVCEIGVISSDLRNNE